MRGAVEVWDQAAEVDASGQAVDCGHVPAELSWEDLASRCVGAIERTLRRLGQADLLAEEFDMCAKLNNVHVLILECLEAGNLRDEVHDAVFATHEFGKTRGSISDQLLTIGVCE